jgi:CelD/BcsL family acetyltransferase involved in cellulose biosynthesis
MDDRPAATSRPGQRKLPSHESNAESVVSAHARERKVHACALDPVGDPRWKTYVENQPDALVYHHPAWLEVLQGAYGGELVAVGCETEDGELRGVLALARTRGLVTGRRLSSLPYTPLAGPLASDEAAMAVVIRAALDESRARNAYLQIKTYSAGLQTLVDDISGVPWETTYIVELPDTPEKLRFGNSRNHSRIKWAVNKAAKAAVRVRDAETETELRAWYELYLTTMRAHVVPPRPYRFFKAMWDVLRPREMMRVLLAEQDSGRGRRLIAGSVFLQFGSTVFYAFTGASAKDLTLRPNDVIQWTALHDACSGGFRRYDMGEVDADDQGLVEFKQKWGGQPTPLYRYYYPAPSRAEASVLKSGRLRDLGKAVWPYVPLKVTERIGDSIYRYY